MNNGPHNPTAEVGDLKSPKCQFESDCGHQNYIINITLPAAHAAYAAQFWIDQMYKWCEANDIKFTLNKWPYANEEHGWTSQWIFYDSEDAVLFGVYWKNYDWGLPHFPV